MELLDAHGAALADFDRLVRAVPGDRWDAPTPCDEWSVRDLVGHLVGEQLWVPSLLAGRTIAEVGDRFDGDQLGDDPAAAWRSAADAARRAWLEPGVVARTVHLSYGTDSATNYGWQMTLDLAVHGWDLATGIGVGHRIPDELAGDLLRVFGDVIPRWQGLGLFAEPVAVPADASPHARLLGLLGRRPD
ncbi:TIGR03086 family metal-binding protein [Pseudonocardia acaciae]|uniref:TIGR03086 family metal-binding protein n=1 Tax=Pseudonocardia acaciae TaxID=551276 RepID=UPI00048D34FD|nr:TIGR03086 family metal-binding protein [Pseudonocardia acaciae]